jgi:hypothetical protein
MLCSALLWWLANGAFGGGAERTHEQMLFAFQSSAVEFNISINQTMKPIKRLQAKGKCNGTLL